uniref:Uncharacterized protein n=1 Tax=Vespula pensylvanica TaxID=30213 RepID=A0A834UHT8_VESPE|nr:hypothetical protein H0235_001805 [Vespula pensylvanica]
MRTLKRLGLALENLFSRRQNAKRRYLHAITAKWVEPAAAFFLRNTFFINPTFSKIKINKVQLDIVHGTGNTEEERAREREKETDRDRTVSRKKSSKSGGTGSHIPDVTSNPLRNVALLARADKQ